MADMYRSIQSNPNESLWDAINRLNNPAVAPAPGKSDAEIQAAALAERRKNLRKRGRASTMLTGGAGLGGGAPTASVALLGQ